MSGEFPVQTYWIYAAIALPISACALGVCGVREQDWNVGAESEGERNVVHMEKGGKEGVRLRCCSESELGRYL